MAALSCTARGENIDGRLNGGHGDYSAEPDRVGAGSGFGRSRPLVVLAASGPEIRGWATGDTPAILSVPRRPLYVVDHERFDRSFRRFELQAEL